MRSGEQLTAVQFLVPISRGFDLGNSITCRPQCFWVTPEHLQREIIGAEHHARTCKVDGLSSLLHMRK